MDFGQIEAVRLINRLVDADGTPVPQTLVFNGQHFQIERELLVPMGVARILIHHSMCLMDPVTNVPQYKLGCPEMGLPHDPIVVDSLPIELLDRSKIPMGSKHHHEYRRIHNPIMRTEPMSVSDPGGRDGAFPGFYGDR